MNTGAYRIGVTGHRWFDDVDDVSTRIDHALHRIRDAQVGAPLEIWSSLAEGADRLVADRALRLPDTTLVVVLPLAPDDYEDDFDDAASKREFRRFLTTATSVTTTGPDDSGTRTSAYRRAGLAVVDAVDTLIAVWDGAPARGVGGTGEIVDLARSTIDTVIIPVTRTAVAP